MPLRDGLSDQSDTVGLLPFSESIRVDHIHIRKYAYGKVTAYRFQLRYD